MNMKRGLFALLLLVGFVLNFSGLVFPQKPKEEKFEVYYPKEKVEDASKIEVDNAKVSIEKNAQFAFLMQYAAVRQENLSLCMTEQCKKAAKNLLRFRYMGEGRCKEINDPNLASICTALQDNQCGKLSDWRGEACQAIADGNPKAFLKALASEDFAKSSEKKSAAPRQVQVLENLATYSAFKYYNAIPCDRYAKDIPYLGMQLSCGIYMANDVNAALDGIANDLAVFTVSKAAKNPEMCGKINNPKIKNICLDPKVDDFKPIWRDSR